MHTSVRARRVLPAFGVLATLAACNHRPASTAPPALPWLVEVASIDAEGNGALSRCEGASCERAPEGTILAPGARIQLDRGVRATLALDADTDLALRDGAELELAQEGGEHVVRLKRGAAVVARRESAPRSASNVLVIAGGRPIVVVGAATVDVRTATPGMTSVVVDRGHVALRETGSATLLATGDGARWREGQAPIAYPRWAAGGDAGDDTAAASTGAGPVRGLGTMTARVPGTEDVVSGVRLASHHVNAEVRDGFARTTVEEEFENETARTLEGRFVFPLPPDASISRLALYVGDDLVEGEIVEKPLATRIFKAIVDDSVRPRDPAILEMKAGSTVSLKVFPIPAKGKRRVILAYDQALAERGDRARYVYPLSLGPDRATTIDDFSVSVVAKDSAAALGNPAAAGYEASMHADEQGVVASYSAKKFAPATDFVLSYTRDAGTAASLSWSMGPKEVAARAGSEKPAGYFAIRLRADAPEGLARRRPVRPARAFVIDTSHSQAADTIEASARVVKAALAALDPEDRFAVLACDSACESYPEDGLARAGDDAIAAASSWIARRGPAGSSDLAGALIAASERVASEGGGQIVYLGDGVATSGELGPAAIAARVAPALRGMDSHFVGVGHSLDETALSAVAAAVSGTYERFATGDPIAERAAAIARTIDAPVLRDARLVVPDGAFDVLPAKLPRLRLGQEIQVFGRFRPVEATAEGETRHASVSAEEAERPARGPLREIRLQGQAAGAPYEIVRSLDWSRAIASPSPAVHALWARAKIATLETSGGGADATKEIVRLSTVHHVLSRATALLVLENERMFVETGVRAAIDRVLASEPGSGEPASQAFGSGHGRLSRAGSTPQGGADPFGMIGALSAPSAPSAPWGGVGLDSGPFSARGSLWGSDVGGSFGAGGLGLSGIGEGGGGRGEGIGLGSIGTIGHGAGSDGSTGFGSGHGVAGSHTASAPRVRMGASTVSGRLPPEVIVRVVRQSFGRFRACYEKGLQSNPSLQGRVSVRFVIDRDGNATAPSNGGSDLPDTSVISCVVRAFAGLHFPQPESGIVTVVYPISFATDSAAAPSSSSSTSSSSTSSSSTSASSKSTSGSSTGASSTPGSSTTGSSTSPSSTSGSSTGASSTSGSSTTGSSTSSSSTSGSSTAASSGAASGAKPWSGSSSTSSSSASSSSWRGSSSSLSTSWRHEISATKWPAWAPNPPPDGPVAVHRAPEEAPSSSGDDAALAKLLARVAEPAAPRSAHQALVRKLLARGRFEDAFGAASRYVGLDPDHDVALELYAEAAAATGRPRVALMAVDAQVEADPSRVSPHRRAAAAFEAAGDERRACAHFRAIASLSSADDTAVYHALRCRSRLGERAAVLDEARALTKPGALVAKLIAALESGSAPPFEPAAASGSFEVRVACRGEATECPAPIVVGPTGTVVSPWTPAAPCGRDALAIASLTAGTYRTLVTGEVPLAGAELTVRVLGQTKTVALLRPGTQVALATTVTLPGVEAF